MARLEQYDIYINTASLGVTKIAECVLHEKNGLLERCGFRYTEDYISRTQDQFSLDPSRLPVESREFEFDCRSGRPGFLDDYLPDKWGAKVLTKYAFYNQGIKLNSHSAIDILSMCSSSHIGALRLVKTGEPCQFTLGTSIDNLAKSEKVAFSINENDSLENVDQEAFNLVYLANSGSGVGGARPKALVYDDNKAYLAKFNQSTEKDAYNNARVEMACLDMARAAGMNTPSAKIMSNINGRDVLLIDRFDVVGDTRYHLITINALMKNLQTQADHGNVFRYNDIFNLISRYCDDIAQNTKQLLKSMLFNQSINNLDDHERNFSLRYQKNGYGLSPAYDMVPTLEHGSYPAAGFAYSPDRPTVTNIVTKGKMFGLSKPEIAECADAVRHAVDQWLVFAENAGVEEQEAVKIQKFFKL